MRSQAITQFAVGLVLTAGTITFATAAELPTSDKDMVLIPKGEFTMGSSEHSDEAKHQVVLDAYLIDKFETSNARYKEFMKAAGHPAPAYWDDPRLNKPGHPVVGVNWYDAKAYCEYRGKRLPTEAEWEKAARGPKATLYPWGNEFDPAKANDYVESFAIRRT